MGETTYKQNEEQYDRSEQATTTTAKIRTLKLCSSYQLQAVVIVKNI